jgi:uncharacterized membrane protein
MNRKRNLPRQAPFHDVDSENQLGLERLIFFSDAVFAIAITLLALEIRLPVQVSALNDAQLQALLAGMWHKFLAYGMSFLVVGFCWIGHHRKFRAIKRYDSALLFLNLLLLMAIAFMPFLNSIISENPNRTATILYASSMLMANLVSLAMWWYASYNNRLIDPRLDNRQRRRLWILSLGTSAVFLLSIGVALIDNDLAKYTWLLILPVSLFANRNETQTDPEPRRRGQRRLF